MDRQKICDLVLEIALEGEKPIKRITYNNTLNAALVEYRDSYISEISLPGTLDAVGVAKKICEYI